ncbi:riboflavin biosynthesis protein [Philodulcilactobacillus myokoensis]|uniref:Riboflavin biosynthesis protein n=1 Tax=Philodulcilactobacillus myokoensis TaxID=2929573 RepID=A0A9W6B0V6_9LACO|nr:riboflavin biosynthesis protein RibF [Philodulcilactobacillus myokoensis]GLB46939.1 riboflavin biosynthesis protein [Philodulcilactobacillus myokoensis]
MEIITLHHPNHRQLGFSKPSVLAMGFFDGVHLGHQAVIKKAKSIAKAKHLKLGVLTYDHHPAVVYQKMDYLSKSYITLYHTKMNILASMGVQFVYVINYTYAFQNQSPKAFVNHYLMNMNLDTVVAGFDHTYGDNQNHDADMKALPSYVHHQINVVSVDDRTANYHKISSTRIKNDLSNGNIATVNSLLGRCFTTNGLIVHGYARGRKLGFPTINVEHNQYQLLPKVGVYVVEVEINHHFYGGMASIGHNVTFGNSNPITVEINIFNFHQNVYGEKVKIYWDDRIRNQIKFDSVDSLIKQLRNDQVISMKYLQSKK